MDVGRASYLLIIFRELRLAFVVQASKARLSSNGLDNSQMEHWQRRLRPSVLKSTEATVKEIQGNSSRLITSNPLYLFAPPHVCKVYEQIQTELIEEGE